MPETKYTVVLIEDDPPTLERLIATIEASPKLSLIGVATNASDALGTLFMQTPDVALIDLGLPDRSGVELIEWLTKNKPEVESLVITAFGDEDHVIRSLEAGAAGYLLKDYSVEELTEHIIEVKHGGSPISPMIARQLMNRIHSDKENAELAKAAKAKKNKELIKPQIHLTERELAVLKEVARGFTAAEIAAQMGISAHTVATHVKRIYRKLHVNNRTEAVFEASITGLLDD